MPTPARVDPPGLRPTAWIRPAALTAAAILCATTGCDGPGAPPRPTTVKVTPPTAEMTALESKVRFRAEVLDQYGNVVDFPRAVWSSGDTVVATVDSSGLATAVANGSVEIVAKAGEASGSATAMVKQLVRRVVVSPATDTIAIGDTLRLVAEGMDANGHAAEEAEFSWSSENDAVATVDASGRVRGRAHGAATITAVADGSEGSAEITVWHPDRWALTSLYDATDGPNWVSSENWLTDRPLGEWHGVRTDGSGGVVQLDLNDNGLTGRIPPELGDLENLEGLYLTNNGLTGQIPPELGDLAKLEHLYLGATELTGKIPPELGGLVNLTVLYLAWAGLTGGIPPELGDLAKLRELSLFGNGLTGGIPPELGGLANLESLYLFDNGLTGGIPSELGGLANLRILSLYNNGLTGGIPAELGDLIDLRTLSLAGNDLSGPVPPEFGQLANLGRLELASNSRMSGALPSILTDLPLDTLQAGGTGLCAPRTAAFADWLGAMSRSWIGRCGATMAYLVQAVQSRTHPVPLVAGEKALLRVFVTAAKETEEGVPPVRARFFADGDETYRVDIPAKSTPIPTEVDEGDLSKSANVEIPGRIVEPGLEMVIEIDPDGTLDDDLGVPKRIPEEDRMAVEVRTMPVLDLTAIPFLWTEDPDSAILDAVDDMEDDPEGHDLLENTRILLPVGGIAVTAHEAVASSSNNAFDLLEETEAIRVLEGGGGHYMGTMSGPVTGPVGVAWAPGRSSFSVPAADVIAHELGHNLSLGHAPCGGAGGPDPSFPDPKGRIGAWDTTSGPKGWCGRTSRT